MKKQIHPYIPLLAISVVVIVTVVVSAYIRFSNDQTSISVSETTSTLSTKSTSSRSHSVQLPSTLVNLVADLGNKDKFVEGDDVSFNLSALLGKPERYKQLILTLEYNVDYFEIKDLGTQLIGSGFVLQKGADCSSTRSGYLCEVYTYANSDGKTLAAQLNLGSFKLTLLRNLTADQITENISASVSLY